MEIFDLKLVAARVNWQESQCWPRAVCQITPMKAISTNIGLQLAIDISRNSKIVVDSLVCCGVAEQLGLLASFK